MRGGALALLPAALLVASLAAGLAAGAAAGEGQSHPGEPRFRYERPVLPGAAGPNRLEPDAALLSRAVPVGAEGEGGLADLRLFDASGREVPYLLLPPARREPVFREGRLLPIAPTKKESGFEVDLGEAAPIDRLRVRGLPAPFLKRFRLEGGGDRSRWTLLVSEGTLFDLPDEKLRLTDVDFPAGEYRYLRLTWDDASSARMPMPGGAEARLVRALDPAPPARVPVAVERRPSEPGKSRFHLRLPGPRLPVVALDLAVPGGPLLRPASVTEGRLAPTSATAAGVSEITPVPLGEAILRRAVRDGLSAADLRIPLTAPQGPDLELSVDDGNNPPLDLASATAELAPLPWIYFETASAAPLTARFGDPRAAAPRYDLEAAREEIAHRQSPPATARWGEVRDREPGETVAGAGPLPALGAPLDPAKFRYHRPVPAAPPGLTSLLLDAAVLSRSAGGPSGSSDLRDLRLADPEGRQVPYLLEKRDEPLSLLLPPLAKRTRKDDPPGLSRYALELPYPALPEARLVLGTSARVFEREVRLVEPAETVAREPGRPDDRGPEERTVALATWRHADPDTAAPALTLEVPPSAGTHFDLLVEEGDNAPLPVNPPHLLLPAKRLRYFSPAEPLQLLYGQKDLPPPRYDLSLLAPRLLGEAAREIALPPESHPEGPEPDAAATGKKIFWGALVGAVLVLLVLLGRLLRGHSEEPAG